MKIHVRFTDVIYFLMFGATPRQIVKTCNVTKEEVWAAGSVLSRWQKTGSDKIA